MNRRLAAAVSLLAIVSAGCARGRVVPAAAPDDTLVVRVHDVSDVTKGEPARMADLLDRARVIGSFPGGSVSAKGTEALVVSAPPRVQDMVAELLRQERDPLRLRFFDVRDLLVAHPTLIDDLRPLLGSVEGRSIERTGSVLVVRAPTVVLEAIGARLRALRAA